MASSVLNIIMAAADDQINIAWFCLNHPNKASNTIISICIYPKYIQIVYIQREQ